VTQSLARDVSLKTPSECCRYEIKNTMKYREEEDPENEKEEDSGVIHIVHGWLQRGQKDKVRPDNFIII
jgi:hypothetical protein